MVFVNGPLVILLVGNLFFFIPSAIQVYQSSKFAAKSAASSNSKLENQRCKDIQVFCVKLDSDSNYSYWGMIYPLDCTPFSAFLF